LITGLGCVVSDGLVTCVEQAADRRAAHAIEIHLLYTFFSSLGRKE